MPLHRHAALKQQAHLTLAPQLGERRFIPGEHAAAHRPGVRDEEQVVVTHRRGAVAKIPRLRGVTGQHPAIRDGTQLERLPFEEHEQRAGHEGRRVARLTSASLPDFFTRGRVQAHARALHTADIEVESALMQRRTRGPAIDGPLAAEVLQVAFLPLHAAVLRIEAKQIALPAEHKNAAIDHCRCRRRTVGHDAHLVRLGWHLERVLPHRPARLQIEAEDGVAIRAVVATGEDAITDHRETRKPFAQLRLPQHRRAVCSPFCVPTGLRRRSIAARALIARPVAFELLRRFGENRRRRSFPRASGLLRFFRHRRGFLRRQRDDLRRRFFPFTALTTDGDDFSRSTDQQAVEIARMLQLRDAHPRVATQFEELTAHPAGKKPAFMR